MLMPVVWDVWAVRTMTKIPQLISELTTRRQITTKLWTHTKLRAAVA